MTPRMPDDATIAAAIALATRAPSIQNTQPWHFSVVDDAVRLFADESLRLPATDPDGRDQMISCGAVLHHLQIAFASLGWECRHSPPAQGLRPQLSCSDTTLAAHSHRGGKRPRRGDPAATQRPEAVRFEAGAARPAAGIDRSRRGPSTSSRVNCPRGPARPPHEGDPRRGSGARSDPRVPVRNRCMDGRTQLQRRGTGPQRASLRTGCRVPVPNLRLGCIRPTVRRRFGDRDRTRHGG